MKHYKIFKASMFSTSPQQQSFNKVIIIDISTVSSEVKENNKIPYFYRVAKNLVKNNDL